MEHQGNCQKAVTAKRHRQAAQNFALPTEKQITVAAHQYSANFCMVFADVCVSCGGALYFGFNFQ
jgi:hypothetical protein